MDERSDTEPTQEVEKALKKLFRHPDPDPAFVADLERRLLARPRQMSRGWKLQAQLSRLLHQFTSWTPTVAWGAVALLLVLGLVWTFNKALPRPELGGAQTPSPVGVTASPTAAPTLSPSGTQESRPAVTGLPKTPQASGQGTRPAATSPASLPSSTQAASDPNAGWYRYTNQGKLAFVKGGNIWVQALPTGAAQRLTAGGGHSQPRWSPSGKHLAYRTGEDRVWVWSVDEKEAQALNGGGPVGEFAWSPARDWLLYVAGEGELRLADGSGRDLRVLVRRSGSKSIPRLAWNPAGDWIAFQWVRPRPEGQPPEVSLWKLSIDGAGPVLLYPVAGNGQDMTGPVMTSGYPLLAGWTGDGRALLFWDGGETFSASLFADGVPLVLLPANGGDPQVLAELVLPHQDFVRPDPSGTDRVAVVAGGSREAWTDKTLYVFADGDSSLVTSPDSAASSPAWSPDGLRVAYAAGPDAGQVGGGEEARTALMQRHIWVRSLGTGGYRQLTSDPDYRDEAPLWSADGESLLFVRMDARGEVSLWLVPAAGGDPWQIVAELKTAGLTPADGWFGYYGHIEWDQLFDWWR